ncbi:MAG: DedA family protein [Terriglobales bacterium]
MTLFLVAAAAPSFSSRAAALLAATVIHVISTLGYGGILLLVAIESACIPLPSEVILPFSGYLAWTGRFNLAAIAVVGALGSNLGSAVAYWVGSRGGRPWVERHGQWLWLRPQDLDFADRWFRRHGEATVFFSRMLPVARTFIALPAGVARMRLDKFHAYTFLGSLPWCWLLAYIGYRLGEHWRQISGSFHDFDAAVLVLLALCLGAFLWRHWPRKARAAGEP